MKYAPNGPISRHSHTVVDNISVSTDQNINENFAFNPMLKEVLHCIGHLSHITLPNGVKPHLEALVEASSPTFYAAHESAYWELYRETVELCRQGWHSFNYWISVEQSTCYRLYWDLKKIAEKHGKPMNIRQSERSLLKECKRKGMLFLKKFAKFLHLHEFEYYRSIATDKDLKNNRSDNDRA